MAARRLKLTKANIGRHCRPDPGGKVVIYWDTRLPGFGLRVGATSRSFVYQKDRRGRRTVRCTIGRYPTWDPEQARKKAQELAGRIDQGENPNETRRAEAARGVTLQQAMDLHMERLRAKGGSPRTIDVPTGRPRW